MILHQISKGSTLQFLKSWSQVPWNIFPLRVDSEPVMHLECH